MPSRQVVRSGIVIFDLSGMLRRLDGDRELAGKVIAAFLDHVTGQVQALRHRSASGDAAGAALEAHSIRGAAANVGGEALRAAAYTIQMAANAGDLGAVKNAMPALEAKLIELEQAIKEKWDGAENQGPNSTGTGHAGIRPAQARDRSSV